MKDCDADAGLRKRFLLVAVGVAYLMNKLCKGKHVTRRVSNIYFVTVISWCSIGMMICRILFLLLVLLDFIGLRSCKMSCLQESSGIMLWFSLKKSGGNGVVPTSSPGEIPGENTEQRS